MRFILQSSLFIGLAVAASGCGLLYQEPPTDLTRTVQRGDVTAVKRLLADGAAAEASLALQWAARGGHPAGPHRCSSAESPAYVEIVDLLLDAGADVNVLDGRPGGVGRSSGWTPLHVAVHHAQWKLARSLVERGADPLRKSDQGLTPIDLAAGGAPAGLFAPPPAAAAAERRTKN